MKKYFALILGGLCLFSSCGGGASSSSVPPPPGALTITTASLPNGTLETPYSQVIQANGGVAPFTWMVGTGALPHNLLLSNSTTNTVTISGTPDIATQGTTFTIKVADSASQSATESYTVSILLEADSVTLVPTILDFGGQLVGTASAVQTETLTNTASSPLAISAIAITGTNAADFNQNQSSSCASSLAAGANCTVNVSFRPSQLGPCAAAVTITDDSAGSPQSVSLNGVGLTSGSNATLSATSLTFGSQVIDTTSQAQSVTLSNYGKTTLNITGIATTANFGESDDCVPSLASGARCTISVTFTPSATGSINGALSVTDNAPGSPQTVSLSGTGVAGRCIQKGMQCRPGEACCPGLLCVPASTRAFCE
jgi:putative Ig domain-containing protein/centrosomal CEP192-like protein